MSSMEDAKPVSDPHSTEGMIDKSLEEKSHPPVDIIPAKRNSLKMEPVAEDVEFIHQVKEMTDQHKASTVLLERLNKTGHRKTLSSSGNSNTDDNSTSDSGTNAKPQNAVAGMNGKAQNGGHHYNNMSDLLHTSTSDNDSDNDMTPSPAPAYVHQKNPSIPQQGFAQQPVYQGGQRSPHHHQPQSFAMQHNGYARPIVPVGNNVSAVGHVSITQTPDHVETQHTDAITLLVTALEPKGFGALMSSIDGCSMILPAEEIPPTWLVITLGVVFETQGRPEFRLDGQEACDNLPHQKKKKLKCYCGFFFCNNTTTKNQSFFEKSIFLGR
ncbi:hypothetical protein RFI_04272 [Reticulomyxa filosa]|uniref:Uncharacterized protein n=1 Tax=Reticulomyxa filosa TaxID=46433 RepID=X6P3S7_RETFI|nr:hypothetical protein RFI_04272 [Reticulomyxa filosa]|eukprot:ETO32846.1 hypothetical protein RFI_04272 [Reticulomyxa filosa]